jgi:hypothetical protein
VPSHKQLLVNESAAEAAAELIELDTTLREVKARREQAKRRLQAIVEKQFGSGVPVGVPVTGLRVMPVFYWTRRFDRDIAEKALDDAQRTEISEMVLSPDKARKMLSAETFERCLGPASASVTMKKVK